MPSEWIIVVLIPLVLAGSVAVLFWLFKSSADPADRRRRGLAALAAQLGWRYFGRAPEEAVESLPSCSLLQRHGAKELHNLMADRGYNPRAVLFDCTSHQPRSTPEAGMPTSLHVVAACRLNTQDIPSFRVYQEDALGGPAGVKGLFRLETEGDRSPDRKLLFAGAPPERVAPVVSPSVRAALSGWERRGPRPVVEVTDRWLVVHVEADPSGRQAQETGAALIDYAERIVEALEVRAERTE